MTSPLRAFPTFLSPLSELEARAYYNGLPSHPLLVARTGAIPWRIPTGPHAHAPRRELRPVCKHALKKIWEDDLALKLHAVLNSMSVKWTSTDVVRIANVEESFAPVVLWIGVIPASLSGDDGVVVASKCKELLGEYGVLDVDVEIRESVVIRSAGPCLLPPTDPLDLTVDLCEPLTSTLCFPICAQSTPRVEGTGGFFITEGKTAERLLLVTARHVVLTLSKHENRHFEHKKEDQCRHNVLIVGDEAHDCYLKSLRDKIERKALSKKVYEDRLKEIKRRHASEETRKATEAQMNETKTAMNQLEAFYEDICVRWATPESRVLGHVTLSPPIQVGTRNNAYTEDWAIVEIDGSRIDASSFGGNAIDLGDISTVVDFMQKMNRDDQDIVSSQYPDQNIVRLEDTIPDEELRRPTARDQNNQPSLVVVKRGSSTGLTFGRANEVCSYARVYDSNGGAETSKEWAILPYDSKSGAFSGRGDSGAVIVDGRGRMGGLITSGAGSASSFDITYATPMSFLLQRIQDHGIYEPNLQPVLTPKTNS